MGIDTLHLILSGLIIPVGAMVANIAFRMTKIENELNARIVRLETIVEIFIKKEQEK